MTGLNDPWRCVLGELDTYGLPTRMVTLRRVMVVLYPPLSVGINRRDRTPRKRRPWRTCRWTVER
jgi:hypothetical protein